MKMGKNVGAFIAVAFVIATIGIALAAVAPANYTAGWHMVTLYSSTGTGIDTGVGIFSLSSAGSDSAVKDGFFLLGGRLVDSSLAMSNIKAANFGPNVRTGDSGLPQQITGSVTAGVGTFYITSSDTARTTVTLTFSDASNATGSWTSNFTGKTGSCSSELLSLNPSGGDITSDSVLWGDSTNTAVWNKLSYYLQVGNGETVINNGFSDSIVINDTLTAGSLTDTARIVVIGPSGKVIGDSQMLLYGLGTGGGLLTAATDSCFISPTIRFDSGVTKVIVIFYDFSNAKYMIKVAKVTVGAAVTQITGGVGTATSPGAMGGIKSATLYISSQTPAIDSAVIADVAGDNAVKADAFAYIDTNTVSFDTRLNNTVFNITLKDINGNPVTTLESGKSFLLVLQFAANYFATYSATEVSRLRLLHRTSADAWEIVSNSSVDSTNARCVAYVDKFSDFALGSITTSSSTAAAEDDNNCVINSAVGNTWLSGVMPALRGMRDTILSNGLGRMFVSGYYGFAGLVVLLATGFGLAYASKRG